MNDMVGNAQLGHTAMLRAEELVVRFRARGTQSRFIRPVDRVSFEIAPGESLALVGESGSGKTTIGRAVVRILEPAAGRLLVAGRDVTHIRGRELDQYRRAVQMIFQDPFASLNPVKTVEAHLDFPVRKHQGGGPDAVRARIDELLERVGLTPVRDMRLKYPHELSGGQRQRLAIARALAVEPRLIVADEPVSMLDVSIRAGVLKLLQTLKQDFGLSFLYITHDLASARYFGDRIMVLYGGRVMETADARRLVRKPAHPYTRLLFAATPGSVWQGPLPEVRHQPPELLESRTGCPFAPRCPYATEACHHTDPPLVTLDRGHTVACHHPLGE
jgi:peptide/nickel transport system ATP-binding protein